METTLSGYPADYSSSLTSVKAGKDINNLGWENYPIKEMSEKIFQIIEMFETEIYELITKINQKIKHDRAWEQGHIRNFERFINIVKQLFLFNTNCKEYFTNSLETLNPNVFNQQYNINEKPYLLNKVQISKYVKNV